MIPLIFVTIVQ